MLHWSHFYAYIVLTDRASQTTTWQTGSFRNSLETLQPVKARIWTTNALTSAQFPSLNQNHDRSSHFVLYGSEKPRAGHRSASYMHQDDASTRYIRIHDRVRSHSYKPRPSLQCTVSQTASTTAFRDPSTAISQEPCLRYAHQFHCMTYHLTYIHDRHISGKQNAFSRWTVSQSIDRIKRGFKNSNDARL